MVFQKQPAWTTAILNRGENATEIDFINQSYEELPAQRGGKIYKCPAEWWSAPEKHRTPKRAHCQPSMAPQQEGTVMTQTTEPLLVPRSTLWLTNRRLVTLPFKNILLLMKTHLLLK